MLTFFFFFWFWFWLLTPLFSYLADEYHTAPTKHLVNFRDLNQILKVEIFLYTDGQLRVAHVTLNYKPSTKHF